MAIFLAELVKVACGLGFKLRLDRLQSFSPLRVSHRSTATPVPDAKKALRPGGDRKARCPGENFNPELGAAGHHPLKARAGTLPFAGASCRCSQVLDDRRAKIEKVSLQQFSCPAGRHQGFLHSAETLWGSRMKTLTARHQSLDLLEFVVVPTRQLRRWRARHGG